MSARFNAGSAVERADLERDPITVRRRPMPHPRAARRAKTRQFARAAKGNGFVDRNLARGRNPSPFDGHRHRKGAR